jgi:hypothetical protein
VVGSYAVGYVVWRAGSAVIANNAVGGDYAITYNSGVMLRNRRSAGSIADTTCNYGGIGYCDGSGSIDNNDDASGYICHAQPGAGKIVNGKFTSDPIYVWGNTNLNICMGGANVFQTCTNNGDCPSSTCNVSTNKYPNTVSVSTDGTNTTQIQANRDYFENTARPGWVPYQCPHPLAGLTGTCDSNVAGTGGYNVGGADTTPPAAPSGLSVN